MTVFYGCCVGSLDKLERWVLPWVGARPLIIVYGAKGIVAAYNQILDLVEPGIEDGDALILLHDDLEILDPDAEPKFLAALTDPDVAMAGVAGGGGESIYWWNHSPVGHQWTDRRLIDFGMRSGDVTLLEGSIMALSPWLVRTLRFDPMFTGFHGYDEIGMQVRAAGKRAVVIDVDTHHHNLEGYASPESQASCVVAAEQYRAKWGL
jgi:Glycosyltransferase like family